MNSPLCISIGQHSDKGRKRTNQDFHGAVTPKPSQRSLKGIALAVADGISSSDLSQIASETAVNSFLSDYFSTSDAWSVRHSGERVLEAINGWLHAQTERSEYRFDKNRGYVCTFSALVFKAASAHIFHIGDSRIYRLRNRGLEQLTQDHRLWISSEENYLSRALGIEPEGHFDYHQIPLHEGDIFLLCTDGVYEHLDAEQLIHCIEKNSSDLDRAARELVEQAYAEGSNDNLTLQIARIDQLPVQESTALKQQIDSLPLPPELKAGDELDGYRIVRELHANSRSYVFLAEDLVDKTICIMKTPSVDLSEDPAYLERLLMEEWVARRINSPHVMKAGPQHRERNYLYTISEYIEGQTLAQWLRDNPDPDLETIRDLLEQIAKGLMAMHRMEILHQDLRPENIMLTPQGTAKIIDFGSVRVAGIAEAEQTEDQTELLGTALYSAPEYFVGELISTRADLYSLAVIAYQMLSGRFPYGTEVAKARTSAAQKRLRYRSVLDDEREIPGWIDHSLRKALQPSPYKRYEELSEFLYDLRHPNSTFLRKSQPPLLERNPVLFWKSLSLLLGSGLVATLSYIYRYL